MEIYSWPEAAVYLFPGGGASAILTYGQNVRLDVPFTWHNNQTMATGTFYARAYDRYSDKNVTLSIGMLYADQSAFWMAHSATAYNARIVFRQTGGFTASAEYQLWSAVFTRWGLQGQENGLWQSPVEMMAADVSGI